MPGASFKLQVVVSKVCSVIVLGEVSAHLECFPIACETDTLGPSSSAWPQVEYIVASSALPAVAVGHLGWLATFGSSLYLGAASSNKKQ